MAAYHDTPRGILYRFIQALTGILILACVVAGYLGLRAIVWGHENELPTQLTSGLTIAGLTGSVLGTLYLILGAHGIRFMLRFDWMSVQVGMVAGVLLYGGYNAVSPLVFTYASEPTHMRALQGAVDGALIGAFIGLLIAFISRRPTLLTPEGIVRFGTLFLLVLTGLSILVYIGTQPGVPRNLPIWLLIPLIISLRFIVALYDHWQLRRRAARFPQDEPSEYLE
jgi:hypothetical protein